MAGTRHGRRTWTDEQLAVAISTAWSWRGVLRNLELRTKDATQLQRAASRLGIDTSHFGSPLRCSDEELAAALAASGTWRQAHAALGLPLGSPRCRAAIEARAARLGLATDHLAGGSYQPRRRPAGELVPQLCYLRDAAEPLAIAWFLLRGLWPAVPAEPRPYDLLLDTAAGVRRLQVKTATGRRSSGAWDARISRHAGGGRNHRQQAPYTRAEVDAFLIFDGDLAVYLIPQAAVSGRTAIYLTGYGGFIVGTAHSLMRDGQSSRSGPLFRPQPGPPAPAAASPATGTGGASPQPRPCGHAPPQPAPAPGSGPWPEDRLRAAVAAATSWADLLRTFGFQPSSTRPREALRREVQRLGIDTSHFAGQRTWSDQALIDAAPHARSWSELCQALGLSPRSGHYDSVQRAARRLGLRLDHLRLGPKTGPGVTGIELPGRVTPGTLKSAAPSIAAAWFLLCGCEVATPGAPVAYDLVASVSGTLRRVQVKTTTFRDRGGSWRARIGHQPQAAGAGGMIAYEPDEVDLFFIVDGDLLLYLIPLTAVAGKLFLALRNYTQFIVGDASSMLECSAAADTAAGDQTPAA